jgi:hypothetical protein
MDLQLVLDLTNAPDPTRRSDQRILVTNMPALVAEE